MIKLKIDNSEILVAQGTTILKAAEQLGIRIPTLCFNASVPNHASCMVCAVKKNDSGEYVPSCATLVVEGMNISSNHPDVIEFRRDALELLLSDHRGDCEAPCQRACPDEKNIPLLNRLIAKNKIDNASEIVSAYSLSCVNCAAPCEKVCRRKQVDVTVRIKELILFIEDKINFETENSAKRIIEKDKKRFHSSYGKLAEPDFEGMLADAENKAKRENNKKEASLLNNETAAFEAQRCMHCDCRKLFTCKLKKYSYEYSASQSKYRFGKGKIIRKQFHTEVLVYESEKCIKCGLCIQVLKQNKELNGLAFIGRGFDMQIEIPFNITLQEAIAQSAADCIRVCPTGALADYNGE